MAPVSTSVWEKAYPQALTLKPENPIPPFMYLVPLKLLTQLWNTEQMNLPVNNSVCMGPLGGTPSALHFMQKLWLFSQPEVVELLFLAQEPWVGEPDVDPGPLTPLQLS